MMPTRTSGRKKWPARGTEAYWQRLESEWRRLKADPERRIRMWRWSVGGGKG